MKNAVSKLHTWSGVVFGWLLFPIFLTGTLSVFAPEITLWMQPQVHYSTEYDPYNAMDKAQNYLEKNAADVKMWRVIPPSERSPVTSMSFGNGRHELKTLFMNPATGEVFEERPSEGGHFFIDFHAELYAHEIGQAVIFFIGTVMLIAITTGIWIHRRKIWETFFTLRFHASNQNFSLDVHRVIGVLALPFIIMITYTGVVMVIHAYLPAATYYLSDNKPGFPRAEVVQNFTLKPAKETGDLMPFSHFMKLAEPTLGEGKIWMIAVQNPANKHASVQVMRRVDDRLAVLADHMNFNGVTGEHLGTQTEWNGMARGYRTQAGLHFAMYGGYWVQSIYFILSLLATLMIAFGLVLFTVKREKQTMHEFGDKSKFMYRFMNAMNIGTIMGGLAGVIVFFIANRLLPATIEHRELWEVTAFFAAWVVFIVHAQWVSYQRAWRKQLLSVALMWMLLPIITWIAVDRSLLDSIFNAEWVHAIVELGVMLFGVCLLWLYFMSTRKAALSSYSKKEVL